MEESMSNQSGPEGAAFIVVGQVSLSKSNKVLVVEKFNTDKGLWYRIQEGRDKLHFTGPYKSQLAAMRKAKKIILELYAV
jgi:hypothetical protein